METFSHWEKQVYYPPFGQEKSSLNIYILLQYFQYFIRL